MGFDGPDERDLIETVTRMLAEDVGSGDLTASLVDPAQQASATIVTRQPMTQAGRPWVDEIYRRLDDDVSLRWEYADGNSVAAGETLCALSGPARALLTGERAALNILQTLSATATATAIYVAAVADTGCTLLDTRKTIPGLRLAQKYAVRCGGGSNHRIGLHDAILVKENHIQSAGGITEALAGARAVSPGVLIEIEVENADQLNEALAAGARRILLDNFDSEQLKAAVQQNRQHDRPAVLEASGNVSIDTVAEIAATGVDYISIGALTKNIHAVDLSMRFDDD
ncbi:MAG: carboxylating nicotinate-nucleotide diphosphorylase [Pseudomonadota bacterium]